MNNNLIEIGDCNVIYYQRILIIVGAIILFAFTFLSIISNNPYYHYFPFIIGLVFLIIYFLYLKIYAIKYNSEYFYISNLLKKERISASQFIEIRKVKFVDFMFVAVFKEKSFLLMI